MRKIIHIDMDAFFASVEQLDNPSLVGKPIAIGSPGPRGVLSTASYEARKFGVKSAMSSVVAAKKCPDLIFVPPHFERYKEISLQIREIFSRYTDIIEPLSLDEAFLDVTYNKIGMPSATIIAQSIKNDIKNELGLIASAGVSYNKFLAKIASDQDKPNGLFIIPPKEAEDFLLHLPVRKFFGVGKVTAEKFIELGIVSGQDLRSLSLEFLINHFGKSGQFFYNVCRGIDDRPVESQRERKSVAFENTFERDIFEVTSFHRGVTEAVEGLWRRYQRVGKTAKTLQLKVKFIDFKSISRSLTQLHGFTSKNEIETIAFQLTQQVFPLRQPVRLIGLQLANFMDETPKEVQLTMEL